MKTYEAIIDGDKVTWIGDRPAPTQRVRGIFQVDDAAAQGTDGRELVAAIETILAETGGITSIEDASAWQRKIRQDRPLDGRTS